MRNFSAVELNEYLKNHQPFLLDVREQWEWNKCHFANSTLLPMGQIMENLANLNKSQETVIICHHGIRSLQVARYFEQIGFINVINLKGGIDAWAKEVDLTMTLY